MWRSGLEEMRKGVFLAYEIMDPFCWRPTAMQTFVASLWDTLMITRLHDFLGIPPSNWNAFSPFVPLPRVRNLLVGLQKVLMQGRSFWLSRNW